jgi:hypothetical protein
MLGLLGTSLAKYTSELMFSFPDHMLTVIFCVVTLLIYPLAIFNNKKIKITGIIISILIIIGMFVLCFLKPPIYSTDVLLSGDEYQFDNTYNVYLTNPKHGSVEIQYEEGLESWKIHAEFKKAGKTQLVLESPTGEKRTFDLIIKSDTYDREEVK